MSQVFHHYATTIGQGNIGKHSFNSRLFQISPFLTNIGPIFYPSLVLFKFTIKSFDITIIKYDWGSNNNRGKRHFLPMAGFKPVIIG